MRKNAKVCKHVSDTIAALQSQRAALRTSQSQQQELETSLQLLTADKQQVWQALSSPHACLPVSQSLQLSLSS